MANTTESGLSGATTAENEDTWSALRAIRDPKEFAATWLDVQNRVLGTDQVCGVVVLGTPGTGPFAPVAVYPKGILGSPTLVTAIETAMEKRHLVINSGSRPPTSEDGQFKIDVIAYPLILDNRVCGAVGFEFKAADQTRVHAIVDQLQWGSAWIEAFLRRSRFIAGDRLVTVLELIATSLNHQRFQAAATAVATDIAGTLNCERVSIAFLSGRHCRVRAVSHSASFLKRANIIRAVEAAMDEAVDQQASIVYPVPDDAPVQVTREHKELVDHFKAGSLCTVPIAAGERVLGALSLERAADDPFDRRTVELCEHMASLIGPLLDVKRKDDRLLIFKLHDSIKHFAEKLTGPRHTLLKLLSGGLAALLLFFIFVDGDFRVTADARLEGSLQRAISAPLAGYVDQAEFRAGDIVHEGDILFSLDDRDLWLERLKVSSEKAQYTREYGEAVALHNRAQAAVLAARVEQVEAQLALIEEQLKRVNVRAPFDGVVVSGDLSQSLGAPVERGDILFEVAPLSAYRVILRVEERDVAEIQEGQTGRLVLSGIPDEQLEIEVTKITPVAISE
ncbi:MAG: HlyD family efflux transporter periplasmic adaptor subunit, partial [Gammaproteobacteria bacterium]|nr:HlyD family efflux transporter periplasmic adaptor subunit [Gammaproteobacteria bacterium]